MQLRGAGLEPITAQEMWIAVAVSCAGFALLHQAGGVIPDMTASDAVISNSEGVAVDVALRIQRFVDRQVA